MDKRIIKALTSPRYACQKVYNRLSPFIKSDEKAVKINYWLTMGKKLDLEHPVSFNEKLQWLKVNLRHPEFTEMVDKAEAKNIARRLMGDEYIVPTYGVWNSFDDIDFSQLPNQFVLKCTHNSGGTVICRDKATFNKVKAKKILNACLSKNPYWATREYPYKEVKPRIIAEKFMSDGRTKVSGLTDYKFFCFSGGVKFLYVSQGMDHHETASISFYDLNGERLPFKRSDYKAIEHFEKPSCFDEMVGLAKKVAKQLNLPFIRIDLYEVHGHIYFSEFTFFPCSGCLPFEPAEWDDTIGNWLKLSEEQNHGQQNHQGFGKSEVCGTCRHAQTVTIHKK